jgi:hypothetical protein
MWWPRRFHPTMYSWSALAAPTLEGLRALLPQGLVMLARADGDEPQIVETWL